MAWRDEPYECPVCSWQGSRAFGPDQDAICPECGSNMVRRSWLDTWGLTLLIFSVVIALVLFVGYFGQS
jgi:ribosomal protein L37AE/L43A